MSNTSKGKYGEELASQYLTKNNYQIIERNYKFSRYGEIDIIALDSNKELCFVEVKTRSNDKFGTGMEAITKEKLLKILACVKNYTMTSDLQYKRTRIDAISVDLSKTPEEITHIKNVEIN